MAKLLLIADPNDLHTLQKVGYLQSHGHGIRLLCAPHEQIRFKSAQPLPDWINNEPLPLFSWKNIFARRRGLALILQTIEQFEPSAILILYAEPHVGWAYYHRIIQKPIALFTYGTDALVTIPNITRPEGFGLIRRYLFKKAFAGIQLLMANSQAQIDKISELLPYDLPKHVVRIALQTPELDTFLLAPPKAPIDAPYILFPRMMQPIYQHEKCLEAIRLLPEAIRKSYRFVFLDSDGTNERYKQLIQSMMDEDLEVPFVWLPRLDKKTLWLYIFHAKLSVQIPSTDGSAVTALECMYLQTPLLLGPAAYDADLFETIPRTHLHPTGIAKMIATTLSQSNEPNDYSATIKRLTDEQLQSKQMETLICQLF